MIWGMAGGSGARVAGFNEVWSGCICRVAAREEECLRSVLEIPVEKLIKRNASCRRPCRKHGRISCGRGLGLAIMSLAQRVLL